MIHKTAYILSAWAVIAMTTACAPSASSTDIPAALKGEPPMNITTPRQMSKEGIPYTADTTASAVMADPYFRGFGPLLFPTQVQSHPNLTLGRMEEALPWYHYIHAERTVSIVNEMHRRAAQGETIFYDIYTEEEKRQDPEKRHTGLFFFRGRPGGKTAVISAGGGFVYVGAMQDSFPHMQALARKGYNAFALIYRPGAETACEDLARTLVFLHEHAEEFHISMDGYSLWGGSAGARMAAWVGSLGTAAFGQPPVPPPAAVIMEYTGLSQVFGSEPPTYAVVGTADTIASYRVMERRIKAIQSMGVPAKIEVIPGLPHGFGLGEGTAAEGWLDRAAAFWEENASRQNPQPAR